MTKRTLTLAVLAASLMLAGPSFAAETMKKSDAMMKDEAMKNETMMKECETMKKDAMMKDGLKKDTMMSKDDKMKHDAMAKDCAAMEKAAMMKHDGMKKDTMMASHYTIKAGDSLWNIAKDNYGDGAMWVKIKMANAGINSENLAVGQTINLPK